MNAIISRAHDALWRAVTEEVALSHDSAVLWSVMLTEAICDQRQGRVQRVIARTGWRYTTTLSRIERSGLPLVSECVDWTSLAYAAALFDGPDDRTSSVGYTLGHPGPSPFNRFMRRYVGMTAGQFRDTVGFPTAREQMLDQVVRPYRDQWATFTHLTKPRHATPPRSLALVAA